MKRKFIPQIPAGYAALLGAATALGLTTGDLRAQNLFDVFFLSDTTGSMGGLIEGAQASSTRILDELGRTGNVRFGVGEYKDGNADAFGFRYNVTDGGGLGILTNDRTAIVDGINAWSATGGGDFPEDNLFGLREAASATPWRPGSRRIVYWFGDAPGLDPASDGTTLATTLAALEENCIQVIAIDLGSLDSTGQATAVTEGTRPCGIDGGEIDSGELFALNLGGLSPDEAADEVASLVLESFTAVTGVGLDDSGRMVDSTMRRVSVAVARTATRDVGDRLFRMRSGVRSEPIVTTQPGPAPSAKGGMAKGGMESTPITITETCPWEVYGQVFYVTEDLDAQYRIRGGVPGTAFVPGVQLLQPDTSIDIYGGTVGFDYDFNENFTAGFAVSASRADADMSLVGDIETDNLTLMPYVSYYRPLGSMAFYADLLYGYGMNDYDTTRLPLGTSGSTDGDFHTLEFNTGLNIQSGQLVHGPLAQVRWVDGEIDSYTEIGPGGLFFPQSDYKSLTTQLGYQVSYPVAMASGTLVPQFRAAWEHEFEDDLGGNLGGLTMGEYDEDLAVVGLGLGYFTNCGWNTVLDYEARLGSESQAHYIGLKVGKEF